MPAHFGEPMRGKCFCANYQVLVLLLLHADSLGINTILFKILKNNEIPFIVCDFAWFIGVSLVYGILDFFFFLFMFLLFLFLFLFICLGESCELTEEQFRFLSDVVWDSLIIKNVELSPFSVDNYTKLMLILLFLQT